MKNEEFRDPLFTPFREAQAPARFCSNVMARIHREKESSRTAPFWARLKLFRMRWLWVAAPALAGAFYLLLPRSAGFEPLTGADVSFYLADSATVEDEAILGTDIENIFL